MGKANHILGVAVGDALLLLGGEAAGGSRGRRGSGRVRGAGYGQKAGNDDRSETHIGGLG